MNERNKELEEILDFVAPGTKIRIGIDNILDAGTGGLIVVGDDEKVMELVDGGFFIDCEYNPQRIYELAKMDGAIILNHETDKILYANVQLQPNPTIATVESGTRHRTGERVAKQTGKLVIAISEKRKRITLYKNDTRYIVRNINDIISQANQAIKTLERYREVLDKALTNLTIMEYDDLVTLYEVTSILQRFEFMTRIAKDLEIYIVELGVEGRLIKMQLEEIMMDLHGEIEDLISDYYNRDKESLTVDSIMKKINRLSQEDLLELENIAFVIGYRKRYATLDTKIVPQGYRILGKIVRLTSKDVKIIVESFDGLTSILEASEDEIAEVDNISRFKARTIKNGIRRLRFTAQLEKS
jgi:diadenylate cyclase